MGTEDENISAMIAAADKDTTGKALASLESALAKRSCTVYECAIVPSVLGSVLENACREKRGTQEVFRQGYLDFVGKMGHEQARGLERALIQHIGLCWLRLQEVEFRYSNVMGGNPTLSAGDYWERRLCSAQRRFLRAAEALARLRKLSLTVQVNVAEKQVNISTPQQRPA
jgi:hypothetical protein